MTLGVVIALGIVVSIYNFAKTPDVEHFYSSKLETVYGRSFVNETVVMDNRAFDHCTFENVKLIYHGYGPTEINGTTVKLTGGQIYFGRTILPFVSLCPREW